MGYVIALTDWGGVVNLDLSEWDRSESDGPPTLTDEDLWKSDLEAKAIEVAQWLGKEGLITVDENNQIDETDRKLTTKHVEESRLRDPQ